MDELQEMQQRASSEANGAPLSRLGRSIGAANRASSLAHHRSTGLVEFE